MARCRGGLSVRPVRGTYGVSTESDTGFRTGSSSVCRMGPYGVPSYVRSRVRSRVRSPAPLAVRSRALGTESRTENCPGSRTRSLTKYGGASCRMLERGDSPYRNLDTGGLMPPDWPSDRPPYKPEEDGRPYRPGIGYGYRTVCPAGKSGRMPGRVSGCMLDHTMTYKRR